jgi:hypothetical protein
MTKKYRPGRHKLICERTGFAIYSGDARKEWTGSVVRKESFEARHPQDFVRGRAEDPTVMDPRPPGEPRFLSDNEVTADDL